MKKTIIAVSALFLTSTAYAGNFEGLSVFAKAGSMSTDTEIKWTGTGDNAGETETTDGNGRSRFVGGIGADYGFKINDKFLTLIGVEGNIGNTDVFKDRGSDGADSESFKFKQKNTYGVYIAPGFLVNDKALIYAKFSYNRMKLEGNSKSVQDGETESFKSSDNFDGFGVGVGARLFIADNIFANVEWQKIQYSSEKFTGTGGVGKFDPETTVGTIAIGYNF
jgi:opacity protein-like surface antigen